MALGGMEIKTITLLGEKGPLTGYDMTKKKIHSKIAETVIMSDPYWLKVKGGLLDGGLIQEVPEKGRRKPYWLTPLGACRALQYGANPDLIVKNAEPLFNEMELLAVRLHAEVAKKPHAPALLNLIGDLMNAEKNDSNLLGTLLKSMPVLNPEMVQALTEVAFDSPVLLKMTKKTLGLTFKELKKSGLVEN